MILLLIQLTIKYSIHAADHNPRQNLSTYEIHVATIKDDLEVKYKLDCVSLQLLFPQFNILQSQITKYNIVQVESQL